MRTCQYACIGLDDELRFGTENGSAGTTRLEINAARKRGRSLRRQSANQWLIGLFRSIKAPNFEYIRAAISPSIARRFLLPAERRKRVDLPEFNNRAVRWSEFIPKFASRTSVADARVNCACR
jgi:hypothetical protein